ncbi:GNAT family N-acetyltransferase [Egibacter rhizosphaerae]|uniref:GNAT family N-acetyltransferase n=1 Tax=Egibacter rhizosphaerae TaxID=1670831 RepID=A0A411YG21_9ACTN|nr:GNAT family N-acetyltransferase [Egibacter rhizosphaerae]QBI20168.1 GNAT family N-acetyltransferase [Egibacter rhizosphaerae]
MRLTDLEPGAPGLDAALAVLRELRPEHTPDSVAERFAVQHAEGYRLTAAFDGATCLGVAGWRVFTTFADGRTLHLDDLVTATQARSGGVGARLLRHLEEWARADGCARLRLDSGVTRHGAHRFYLREGYRIASHHFEKDL